MKNLALLTCLICLLLPGSVALSQPFPSFMLDTTVTHVPGSEDLGSARVAFGPDVGLVVWAARGIRGVRVDRDGALQDSVQIVIGDPDRTNGQPAVAWSGQSFLVAWTDDEAMKYALVAPDGSITTRAVLQDREWRGSGGLATAFDGTSFLVSWVGGNETLGRGALFCRVSPDGSVLDRPPRFVAPLAPHEQSDIALCFHADRYLAVWTDGDPSGLIGVSANFIFPDGSIADSAGFCIRSARHTGHAAVTHDRSNFLVSWGEDDIAKLARVNDSGTVLDTAATMIDGISRSPALVSNGDTTLVVFANPTWNYDSVTLVGVRFDSALDRLDTVPVKLSHTGRGEWNTEPEDPCIALCSNSYFFAWTQPLYPEEPSDDCSQVLCRRMNQDGELLDSTPAVLSLGPARQGYPNVASDGESFLAAWPEDRHDSLGRLYYLVQCSRFTADGDRLDPNPIPLGKALYDIPPGVAYGGGCYLVTWQDSTGIWARRVTSTGVVPDSAPLHLPEFYDACPFTDVAFGDSLFLVAWRAGGYCHAQHCGLAPVPAIHGCRVTPAGTTLDSTPLLLMARAGGNPLYPQVGFDGDNFLVVRRDGEDQGVQRCVRVSRDGAVLDTDDITLGPAGGNYYPRPIPDVAFGNGVYFVVDNQTGRCCRVSPDGYLIDSVVHARVPCANVVFDGTDFMLVCQSTDTSSEWLPSLGAMRITPNGRVVDSVPFVLVAPESAFARALGAAASANAAGRVGLVFSCEEPSPYMTQRIRAANFPAIVGIHSGRDDAQPVAFRFLPNPASKLAVLSFNVAQAGPVHVTAFDAAGRRCASLFSGRMAAGRQTLPLDMRRLANGVYFLRLQTEAATHSTRLVVSR